MVDPINLLRILAHPKVLGLRFRSCCCLVVKSTFEYKNILNLDHFSITFWHGEMEQVAKKMC